MTELSPKQMVNVIVRSLGRTAKRFKVTAKKEVKASGANWPNRKFRSVSGRGRGKSLRKH
jgi:hypothetical protein